MKVLSLFDGISVARLALENLGVKNITYYASEVDEYAIKISNKNFPDIIQLGDVKNVGYKKPHLFYGDGHKPVIEVEKIDLLIGGSPCQDLSIAQSKKRTGLCGDKSSLFYEYVRVLKELKPKYFVLENVASMSEESKKLMSEELGVEPILINANHFSAQNRARLFWTNISIGMPQKSSHLKLKDILEKNVDEKFFYKDVPFEIIDKNKNCIGKIQVSGHDILKRIHNINSKSPTVDTCSGGNRQIKILDGDRVRKLTPLEYERLQGLPDNYTQGVSNSQRYKGCGNAFSTKVVEYIIKKII